MNGNKSGASGAFQLTDASQFSVMVGDYSRKMKIQNVYHWRISYISAKSGMVGKKVKSPIVWDFPEI